MDFAVKLGILMLAMVVLYALSRSFSEPKESVSALPDPAPETQPPEHVYNPVRDEAAVRPVSMAGTRIDNYGFTEIDLSKGPPDPEDFLDELMVHFYGEGSGHGWNDSFTVCTPRGIARYMREKGYDSLLATGYIIVERYDIDLILETILEPADDEEASTGEPLPDTAPSEPKV
jgi:hypothetical protein